MKDADGDRASSAAMWRYAAILAALGLLCTVLLGGLSAWFLGAVAWAGLTTAALTFNFHIPGALVRLFAIGRTAARYGERLAGHKAALTDQCAHRVRLFSALASSRAIRTASWQLADDARLTDFLDDVEDIDYARLRVWLPMVAAVLGVAVCTLGTTLVAPAALLLIGPIILLVLAAERHLRRAGAKIWTRARHLRRTGERRIGAIVSAATPLQAEKRWRRALSEGAALLTEAERIALAIHRRQARLEVLAAWVGPLAAASVLGAAWMDGSRGEALLPALFVAFCWFALTDTLQGLSRLSIASVRKNSASAAMLAEYGERREPATPLQGPITAVTHVSCRGLRRRAPDGRPLGRPLDLQFEPGRPAIFTGVSGAGKTSLLKQVAGWTGDDVFDGSAGPLPTAARRAMTWFGLHDAAVLADTVRANLFAGPASDADLWDALVAVELDARVRNAGGLDGWITQDTLSLGEVHRFGLARAWLSPMPIIVMDEPTEHLQRAMAERIMARLLDHLGDKLVILSSHHASELDCFGRCHIHSLDDPAGASGALPQPCRAR